VVATKAVTSAYVVFGTADLTALYKPKTCGVAIEFLENDEAVVSEARYVE